jgi:cytochrome P450
MKEAYKSRHEVNRTDMAQQVFDIYEKKGEKVDFTWGDVNQKSYDALFAGSDTTAIAFRSLFYHLMHSPNIYARLEKEVDEAVKEGRMDMPPKYKQASELPYLCACTKETLRIYPPAQLSLPWTVSRGGMELCGQFIPEGYIVGSTQQLCIWISVSSVKMLMSSILTAGWIRFARNRWTSIRWHSGAEQEPA